MQARKLIGHVAVHPLTGYYLCRDDEWRRLPHFGTLRTCVRFYRTSTWALKASARRRGSSPVGPGETIARAVTLYDNDSLLHGGHVLRGRTSL